MIKINGTKLSGLAVIGLSALTLSACSGWNLPECNQELDECNRGGAYTEERTVQADRRRAYVQPVPEPVLIPEPVPVVRAPAPEPILEPIMDDTPVMQSAEPQFTQISK